MDVIATLQDQLTDMWVGFIKTSPLLIIGLLTLVITWVATKISTGILTRVLKNAKIRPSLKELFSTLLKIVIWIIGFLISITIIFPSLTPAKLLTALGLGSVAIGLAFKDIFENFFAGVLIMLRRPMRIGDFIECDGLIGKVENISLRETYLRQVDGQLIILPNRHLFQNPVNVITDKQLRRFEIIVGVAYSENLEQSRRVIQQAVEGLSLVETNHPVGVYAREFNSSSIDFTVHWWSESSPGNKHESRDQVVSAIKTALDEAGIEIPFPYRTLTFKQPLQIQNPEESDQS